MIAIYGVGAKADGSELSLVTIAWNEKVAPMQCMRCMSSHPRCVCPTLLVERTGYGYVMTCLASPESWEEKPFA